MRFDWQYDLYFSEDIIEYPNYAAEVVPPQVAVWSYFDGELYEQTLSGQALSGSGNLVSLLKHRKRKIVQKRKVIIAGKAVCDQLPQEIYAEGRLSLTGYANVFQAKQKINISGEAMEYGDDELLFLLLAA